MIMVDPMLKDWNGRKTRAPNGVGIPLRSMEMTVFMSVKFMSQYFATSFWRREYPDSV